MNFKNIFILPNDIGDRSRRRFGGIFIKIPKVTSARSSLMDIQSWFWSRFPHIFHSCFLYSIFFLVRLKKDVKSWNLFIVDK